MNFNEIFNISFIDFYHILEEFILTLTMPGAKYLEEQ